MISVQCECDWAATYSSSICDRGKSDFDNILALKKFESIDFRGPSATHWVHGAMRRFGAQCNPRTPGDVVGPRPEDEPSGQLWPLPKSMGASARNGSQEPLRTLWGILGLIIQLRRAARAQELLLYCPSLLYLASSLLNRHRRYPGEHVVRSPYIHSVNFFDVRKHTRKPDKQVFHVCGKCFE